MSESRSASIVSRDLDLEQRVRGALGGVENIVLHLREKEAGDLAAVMYNQVFFVLARVAQDRDEAVRIDLCEVEPRDVELALWAHSDGSGS